MEERNVLPDPPIPTTVSYRQLAAALRQAPAEPAPRAAGGDSIASEEREALETLLAAWCRSSHELLTALRSGGEAVAEGRSPRQLMALGALQAHLAMALQAHAGATGRQQE